MTLKNPSMRYVFWSHWVSACVIKNHSHQVVLCTCSLYKCASCIEGQHRRAPIVLMFSDASSCSLRRTLGDQIGDIVPPVSHGSASVPSFSWTRLKLLPGETSWRRSDQMSKVARPGLLMVEDFLALPNRNEASFWTISSCGCHIVTWLCGSSKVTDKIWI